MENRLSEKPEPTEVELELTNHCNASCLACPRDQLTAEKGFMDEDTFHTIIEKYENYREGLAINKIAEGTRYPFISFAGMGEPLLHSKIFDFVRHVRSRNFKAVLFTNASLLNEEKAGRLVEAGINHLNISFWGINEREYRLSMGLDFSTSLKNVEYMSKLASKNNISIIISWIKNKYITSTTQEIVDFWNARGLEVDIEEDNQPWNRGGYLSNDSFNEDFDSYPPVNYDFDVWCSQMFFTDTVCWNGDVVICSCDYYKKENVIGNLKDIHPDEITNKKHEILSCKAKIPVCLKCKKPDRNYPLGSSPWDELLSEDEKQRYYYFKNQKR
ncbi:4Fe-4S single cluster protein [Anaerobacterium chartisolvens]|uniref:4Fe-4S single cluster protein n=1 Tax=Anaerobacterium chartisolvens TaxID=1297424 RepID=A0A369AQ13_9FIRM|nr:radical SAM protein [Anaerobacterium chartisolvens]RCX11133.1 4Fe-4S single cluster protein [Anaerobacterium chartisolvens]